MTGVSCSGIAEFLCRDCLYNKEEVVTEKKEKFESLPKEE
jgi:hypothetical protein